MNNRFNCKLKNVEVLSDIMIATYIVGDIKTGYISIDDELTSYMKGELKVSGRAELFIDIPAAGSYEEILKHFELWEELN